MYCDTVSVTYSNNQQFILHRDMGIQRVKPIFPCGLLLDPSAYVLTLFKQNVLNVYTLRCGCQSVIQPTLFPLHFLTDTSKEVQHFCGQV